jgi:hypothetical protein
MNLISWQFVRAIVCSSPQRDEFEVESLVADAEPPTSNLLSNKHRNGFVVDTFVRPPVHIYIIFNQPVRIDSIHLDAKVNMQISNGFTIATSVEPCQSIEQSLREHKSTAASHFQQVARLLNEKNKLCHVYEFTRRLAQSSAPLSANTAYFSTRSSLYLDKATSVCISITRTLNSTSACLRSVKIIGSPGLNNELREFPHAESRKREVVEETATSNVVEIPSEFIDELTHECMRMPMRLPSKKYIDKSTLDKYLSEEGSKKEAAKDPFTRLPFTSVYKPVIDETLKSRIDRFYFDNRGRQIVYASTAAASTMAATPTAFKNGNNYDVSREDLKRNLRSMSMDLFKNELGDELSLSKRARVDKVTCSGCLNVKSQELCFYEIQTCKHLYCRNCLVSLGKKCAVCKVGFKTSQVINFDRACLDK